MKPTLRKRSNDVRRLLVSEEAEVINYCVKHTNKVLVGEEINIKCDIVNQKEKAVESHCALMY